MQLSVHLLIRQREAIITKRQDKYQFHPYLTTAEDSSRKFTTTLNNGPATPASIRLVRSMFTDLDRLRVH